MCVCVCARARIDLSIDAMDVSGDHQLDVLHSVYKTRLSLDGQPISEATEQYKLGTVATDTEGKNTDTKQEEKKPECGRCLYCIE